MSHNDDVLIRINLLNNFRNVVKVAEWVREYELQEIAFNGGQTAKLAQATRHVSGDNYGTIENIYQNFMHILTLYINIMRVPH
jgi:phosphoheptose isomerase